MNEVWIGVLHDNRQVLHTEPRPPDALPRITYDGTGTRKDSYWRTAWRCTPKQCNKVATVKTPCRCQEVFR